MSPIRAYLTAGTGALICTAVALIEWGVIGALAVAAPCVILLLIALPHVLGAADDVGSADVRLTVGRLTIGFGPSPDPDWPDWIDIEGEPIRRHDATHTADAVDYLHFLERHAAARQKATEDARTTGTGVLFVGPDGYHTCSPPTEVTTCPSQPCGSPES